MVVAQKVKEAEITEQDSLLLTRNLLRIAIFNISYIRGLFPEKYFNDKSVPALEMKVKKLIPMDAESRRLIDWMEKGVYDALRKKYLKTLLFCVCEAIDGPMIEEYAFSFSYSDSDSQEVSMNVNRTGTKKGGIFKCDSNTVITPNQMRSSACKMIRTLVQLMRTLDTMPAERTILMKLIYYDDVTPVDYEPPFFRVCTDEEGLNPWTKSPLKMEVGNVNSKHLVLSLKMKSVLDPCEDENNEMEEDGISIGADSGQNDESSESDSEVNASQEDQYIVALAAKIQPEEENGLADEDNTQDPEEDEQQLSRVRDWVSSRHLDAIELTDVLSHFPDISIVLTEEIMDKLVNEGVLFKTGTDTFTKKNKKVFDYEFATVKEEDCRQLTLVEKAPQIDDSLYVKALYHVLQMKYVSAAKLQNKLDGEVTQAAARKIIDRMTRDGYLDPKGNGRLGKRVIQSVQTEKKLIEVRRALDNEDADMVEAHEDDTPQAQAKGKDSKENSTCGILHSIGSDLTRMRISSETKNQGCTPVSRPEQPVASRESFAPGSGSGKANGKTNHCDEADTVVCSKSSRDKRSRKTSMVKEPILQYLKRQKSQAA